MKIGPKLWPLECSQVFYLVFDPTWLIFELDPDFIKANILTNFHGDWMHNVDCRVFTRFSYDLTYWPSFWAEKTHTRTWPSSRKLEQKLWPLECSHGFSIIWPTDLVFGPMSPILELDSRWSFWASLMKIGPKLWPLECSQGFQWFDLLT